jgi:hypothetical protein
MRTAARITASDSAALLGRVASGYSGPITHAFTRISMHPRTSARLSSFTAVLVLVAFTGACADDALTSPVTHTSHAAARPDRGVVASLVAWVGRVIDTPMGGQPRITPSLRIESPSTSGRVVANQPVTIRVRYENFDNQPALRTPNAGATLGSQPQVLTDGYVQGHVHGYLQRLDSNRGLPEVNATSFCVLERVPERQGYNGVAEGECPGVPAGEYRLSAEFQTNSHTSILKDGPRATPTADIVIIRVR